MKEKEPKVVFTDRVREMSHKIVERSTDILTVNNLLIETDLVKRLQEFQNTPKTGPDPFVEDYLAPENELGLNLFLDVVNFCYRDPVSRQDYVYVNKEGQKKPRSIGLKAAMPEADINWGSIAEVANIDPEKWREIIQLDKNQDFYLGAERGKRISLFAKKLFFSGSSDITDFLISAKYDTDLLLPALENSGFFTDEFQKRSQLAVNMMDGVLRRRFSLQIKGTENLTIMADYRLPQLMYNFGAINLNEKLKDKLMSEEIIESGSDDERALRAASVVIGEKLSNIMELPEGKIDSLLWKMAVDMGLKGLFEIPHMLVATDKY